MPLLIFDCRQRARLFDAAASFEITPRCLLAARFELRRLRLPRYFTLAIRRASGAMMVFFYFDYFHCYYFSRF